MSGVLITGAAGYLGSSLSSFLVTKGIRVVAAVRDVTRTEGEAIIFSLGTRTPASAEIAALGIDTVVHCAHDFTVLSWREMRARNVDGTLALARAAADAGVARQIFVSTLSAFPGCVSRYGRAKLLAETGMELLGAVIVRPGLLYDENPRGLVGMMKRLVARLPIIPLIGSGDQPQFTCHVEDLCACLFRLIEGDQADVPRGPITAAHPVSLPFKEIVGRLATATGRGRPRFVPIPWRLVWAGLKALEFVGLHAGLRSDSVLGLQFATQSPEFASQARMGVSFRPFQP